jgi:hypothetical protein
VPTDYDIKPISIHDQVAEIAFHLGGKRATPLVGPPHFTITKSN